MSDILAKEPVMQFEQLTDTLQVAYPELAYLRDSGEQIFSMQVLRAVYLAGSGVSEWLLENALEDRSVVFSYRCQHLLANLRRFLQPLGAGPSFLEGVLYCVLFRVLGTNEGFRQRFGRSCSQPEQVVLQAIEHERHVLPSFQRLSEKYQELVMATLQAWFPLELLVNAEAVPAHLTKIKDQLLPLEGGVEFFLCALALEHAARHRSADVSSETADIVRLAGQAIASLDKYAAPRAYELYLKRRAERMHWRLPREDHLQRAIIRLACAQGIEESEAWSEMMAAVEGLTDREKEAVQVELGVKDGLSEAPAYVLEGGGLFLAEAYENDQVPLESGVKMLARILEDASRTFGTSLKHKVVRLSLEGLPARARAFRVGDVGFEDLAFTLEEKSPGEVAVRVAGG